MMIFNRSLKSQLDSAIQVFKSTQQTLNDIIEQGKIDVNNKQQQIIEVKYEIVELEKIISQAENVNYNIDKIIGGVD